MRTVGTKLVGLVVTSLLVTGSAYASSEDTDKELSEMRALVKELGQKVDAQQEQLEHQSGMLQDAQKVVRDQQHQDQEKGALSGVGEFWQAIDVNMSAAGSYAWNFNNPSEHQGAGFSGAGANQGANGAFYPFHGDHNSFQVDQVWLDIGKKVTDESRAGFMFSILYGNVASYDAQAFNLQAIGANRRSLSDDSTSDYYVAQAYVKYLAPLGEGVEVDLGKFETLLGAEVADQSKNWNITRSNLWTLMQSIDHTGLLVSTTAGPLVFAGGVVNQNNVLNGSPDVNNEKSYLAKVAFAPKDGPFSVAANVLYGEEGSAATGSAVTIAGAPIGIQSNRDTGLFDLLANFNSDAFSAWANFDYGWVEGSGANAWGAAIAGMVPFGDLSATLRLEYLRDHNTGPGAHTAGVQQSFFPILGGHHSDIYGATGTLAYKLAENLTAKTEIRWDHVNETGNGPGAHEFFTSGANREMQVVGLAQLVYAF